MTSFEDVYAPFFDKIVQDIDFFYYGTTTEEGLEIARERSKAYLLKSIDRLTNQCSVQVDFYNLDELLETFNFDLVNREKTLFADMMYEIYYEQDLVKLRLFEAYFTQKDLKTFDPNAQKKIYLDSLAIIKSDNIKQIKNYESRDRITGQLKGLDYSGWDD